MNLVGYQVFKAAALLCNRCYDHGWRSKRTTRTEIDDMIRNKTTTKTLLDGEDPIQRATIRPHDKPDIHIDTKFP